MDTHPLRPQPPSQATVGLCLVPGRHRGTGDGTGCTAHRRHAPAHGGDQHRTRRAQDTRCGWRTVNRLRRGPSCWRRRRLSAPTSCGRWHRARPTCWRGSAMSARARSHLASVLPMRPTRSTATAWWCRQAPNDRSTPSRFSSVKFEQRAPDGYILLRAFFGGSRSPQSMELDDATLDCHGAGGAGAVPRHPGRTAVSPHLPLAAFQPAVRRGPPRAGGSDRGCPAAGRCMSQAAPIAASGYPIVSSRDRIRRGRYRGVSAERQGWKKAA